MAYAGEQRRHMCCACPLFLAGSSAYSILDASGTQKTGRQDV